MRLSELGEFGLIALIDELVTEARTRVKAGWQNVIVGIGDDAAVFKTERPLGLSTIDTLVEGIHFNCATLDWLSLGWKALAVSLSDIAAMGGRAENVIVALGLPEDAEVENVKAFYAGLVELAAESGVAVVGGNISRSPVISLTTSVFGSAESKAKLLLRSNARPGDKIAVTGHPGTAACGFKMLNENISFDPETTKVLKNAFLRPQPRLAEGEILVKQGIRTAIDISDGLISDLKHVLYASGVSARIELGKLPISPAVQVHFPDEAVGWSLAGGEDYELLFTGSERDIERATTETRAPVTVIGDIRRGQAGELVLIGADGKPVTLPESTGWQHF